MPLTKSVSCNQASSYYESNSDETPALEEACRRVMSCSPKDLAAELKNPKNLSDDLAAVLHAAYYPEIRDFLDRPYLKIIRSPDCLTKKSLVDTLVLSLLQLNQSRGRRALEPLVDSLSEEYTNLPFFVYEVPSYTVLKPKVCQAFAVYSRALLCQNTTKKQLMDSVAFKTFSDCLSAIKAKKTGQKKCLRSIDTQVSQVLQITLEKYQNQQDKDKAALPYFIFKAPDLDFMPRKVYQKFIRL